MVRDTVTKTLNMSLTWGRPPVITL